MRVQFALLILKMQICTVSFSLPPPHPFHPSATTSLPSSPFRSKFPQVIDLQSRAQSKVYAQSFNRIPPEIRSRRGKKKKMEGKIRLRQRQKHQIYWSHFAHGPFFSPDPERSQTSRKPHCSSQSVQPYIYQGSHTLFTTCVRRTQCLEDLKKNLLCM